MLIEEDARIEYISLSENAWKDVNVRQYMYWIDSKYIILIVNNMELTASEGNDP